MARDLWGRVFGKLSVKEWTPGLVQGFG